MMKSGSLRAGLKTTGLDDDDDIVVSLAPLGANIEGDLSEHYSDHGDLGKPAPKEKSLVKSAPKEQSLKKPPTVACNDIFGDQPEMEMMEMGGMLRDTFCCVIMHIVKIPLAS